MAWREKVIVKNYGGRSIAHGQLVRFSRYGVEGEAVLPSSPVSLRLRRRDGKAEMYGTPGQGVSQYHEIVRQAMLEPLGEGEDPKPRLLQTQRGRYYNRFTVNRGR
jgi:hypothetical protein